MNLAPNGKPSNLTAKQYKLVRTKAFKDWFGDWENSPETASKVVDTNGEPLVVWHGTDKSFTEFKKGKYGNWTFFTADFDEAIEFGQLKARKPIVVSAFLNVRNPNPKKFNLQMAIQKGELDEKYDGAFQGGWDIAEFRFVVVKKSNQIKLADGTNTTFDINNPDIRFGKGGKTNNFAYPIGGLWE